jgi:hypothetical protein
LTRPWTRRTPSGRIWVRPTILRETFAAVGKEVGTVTTEVGGIVVAVGGGCATGDGPAQPTRINGEHNPPINQAMGLLRCRRNRFTNEFLSQLDLFTRQGHYPNQRPFIVARVRSVPFQLFS